MILTAMKGIVAVVRDNAGLARISTSPVQFANCAPGGGSLAVTRTCVPGWQLPLGFPLSTVNATVVETPRSVISSAKLMELALAQEIITIAAILMMNARMIPLTSPPFQWRFSCKGSGVTLAIIS